MGENFSFTKSILKFAIENQKKKTKKIHNRIEPKTFTWNHLTLLVGYY